MRVASSRAAALATLVIMTMRSLLPACVQVTPEAKKTRPPHVPLSSHRLRIGPVLGAGLGRRLVALRQVRVRRLRPAGRLTCRVHAQKMTGAATRSRTLSQHSGSFPSPACDRHSGQDSPKKGMGSLLFRHIAQPPILGARAADAFHIRERILVASPNPHSLTL